MDLSLLKSRIVTKMSGSSEPDILLFDEVTSTNDILKERFVKGISTNEGTTLVSFSQTKGKGRSGRSFFSPKDSSIYMSILLSPNMLIEKALLITPLAAAAVYEALHEVLGIECGIKWVNDLYYKGKKICGILAEAQVDVIDDAAYPQYVILGIGINVFMPSCKVPDDLQEIFGTIFDDDEHLPLEYKGKGREILFGDLIFSVREKIMNYYLNIERRDFMSTYRSSSMVIGRRVSYISGEEATYITVVDIDDDASIIALQDDGTVKAFKDGEIRILL